MTELEELMAQREEIDRKIKMLTTPNYEVWRDGYLKARLSCSQEGKPWCVTVKEIDDRRMLNKRVPQHKCIVHAKTKQDAINHLAEIIEVLDTLYAEVTGFHIYGVDLNNNVPPTGAETF